jgi:hypothetical protein
VLGWLLVAGVCVGLKLTGLNTVSWRGQCEMVALLAAMLLGMAAALWPNGTGVDDRGIWQRHFFRWRLWPWEAFASGAVRTGPGKDHWVCPEKPWYARGLSLGVVAEADRVPLAERILQAWKPPAISLPEEIKLRQHHSLQSFVDLSPGGIALAQEAKVFVPDPRAGRSKSDWGMVLSKDWKGPPRSYAWSEVVQLRVTRLEHWRRDFCRLEVELPGSALILLRSNGDGQQWDGPDAEVVLAYLRQYVGDDWVQVTALEGPPRTPDEADRRLRDLDKSFRAIQKVGRLVYGALVIVCVLPLFQGRGALNWGTFQWSGLGLYTAIQGLFGVGNWMWLSAERRRYEVCRSELMKWVAENRGQASGPSEPDPGPGQRATAGPSR